LADLLLGTAEFLAADAPLELPDRFVPAFAAGGVLTIWLDGCVALWPAPAWSSLTDRIGALPLSLPDGRAFERVLFSSAVEFEIEPGARRLAVPEAHRRQAGIDGPAVLVGAGDHAELWDAARCAAVARQRLEDLALPVTV